MDRTIEPAAIEAGVLDRTRTQRRKFRRLDDDEITAILQAERPGLPSRP